MYNTDAEDVRRRLTTLSDQERSVLRLRCGASDYKTIADTLHIAIPTVKQYMSRIYVKLGLDQLSRTERTKALFESFCPVFEEATLPSVEGEVVEEPVPPSVEKMVDEDENAIILVRPQPTESVPRSSRQEVRKPSGFRTLVFGVVLGICLSAGVIFLIFRLNIMSVFLPESTSPTYQNSIQEPTNQVMVVLPTDLPTDTPMIVPEATTAIATQQPPTEAPTLTPIPQPQTLFADDFEQGLSGSWSVITGSPVVVNGQLTSNEDTWIRIGDESWKNYTVQLDAQAADCWFSWSWSAIGLRVQDLGNMVAFKWAYCENEWNMVENGNWNLIPNSHISEGSYGDMKIIVSVERDKFSVDINGARVSSFFNSEYPLGGVAIKVGSETLIDNLKIFIIEQ